MFRSAYSPEDTNNMKLKLLTVAAATILMFGACSKAPPAGPVKVFPDAETPDIRQPSYSLTESPDGTIRIFTKENGDEAWLYEMHKTGNSWSAPERMELPARRRMKGASFNRQDGVALFRNGCCDAAAFQGERPEYLAGDLGRRGLGRGRAA